MAGVNARQIDMAEVHDCFTIAEVLATEDLGFAARGEGGRFARNGEGRLNEGGTTVNASGGLKSRDTHSAQREPVKSLRCSSNCEVRFRQTVRFEMQKPH